ncbi:MAG: class I SAM-dependent methyltransferase [Candidatus Bipolaricaulota bacterium]
MLATWDELFKEEEHRWRRPSKLVVEFTRVLRRCGAGRVLDVGCGAGRHMVFLARQGFQVYGIDDSPAGLAHARAWVEQEGLEAEFRRGEMTMLPYRDGFFDGVVCVFTIYHGTLAQVRKAVAEIRRVLRPGGAALITFKSRESYRFGCGRQIEPNTFAPDEGDDAGTPHHYSDRGEVEELLSGFSVLRLFHLQQGAKEHLSAWWVTEVTRPEGDL